MNQSSAYSRLLSFTGGWSPDWSVSARSLHSPHVLPTPYPILMHKPTYLPLYLLMNQNSQYSSQLSFTGHCLLNLSVPAHPPPHTQMDPLNQNSLYPSLLSFTGHCLIDLSVPAHSPPLPNTNTPPSPTPTYKNYPPLYLLMNQNSPYPSLLSFTGHWLPDLSIPARKSGDSSTCLVHMVCQMSR